MESVYSINYNEKNIIVSNFGGKKMFSLEDTLECGQCFRFDYQKESGRYFGVANNIFLEIQQINDELIFYNISKKDFEYIFFDYFDFSQNYGKIIKTLKKDATLKKMIESTHGLHILKQDLWESLISFIISQNNNIKRIKGIIKNFCESFGTPLENKPNEFTFPDVKTVSKLTLEDLAPLKAGFRAKYILDAAEKAATNVVDLDKIKSMEYDEAKIYLQQIKGVGPKVADCALLFGAYKIEAFPIDVWIKRAMETYFKKGVPEFVKPYGGIAQQYIFHYTRNIEKK